MDNPLNENSALLVPVEDEQKLKSELLAAAEPTVLEARKKLVEYRRQLLGVQSREKNSEAVETINGVFTELLALVADPDMALRVTSSIESGKDFNEFVKGMTALVDLRDKLQDRMIDETVTGARKKRILASFQGQGVKMMVGVETDG